MPSNIHAGINRKYFWGYVDFLPTEWNKHQNHPRQDQKRQRKMQDLLLKVYVPEDKQTDYRSNDVSDHETNHRQSMYQTSQIKREDEPIKSKTPSYPEMQMYMYQSVPETGVTPITPQAIQYLVRNYRNGPTTSTPRMHPKSVPRTKNEGYIDKSSDEAFVDVENDSLDNPRTSDTSKDSNNSLLSDSLLNSPYGSSNTSLSPKSSRTSTPESTDGTKKKVRTNYSPDQVQALEKVFHEQPYPDSEMMEKLSKDLDIPETKIKVWFQNKRARWRRRVQETSSNSAFYPFMPPVVSPITPYGFMPGHPMFPSGGPAPHMLPGNIMYPTPVSPSQVSPQQQQMTSHPQARTGLPQPFFYPYPCGIFPQPYYRS